MLVLVLLLLFAAVLLRVILGCCSDSISLLWSSSSSSVARRRLLGPRAGTAGARLTMRLRCGAVGSVACPDVSFLRERRRSLSGAGACVRGGVGSSAWKDVGGVMGSSAVLGAGIGLARRECRERHVEKMLPTAD